MVPTNYTQKNSKGTEYHLNTQKVTLRGGREQRIYFFSKDERATACALPDGFKVVQNPRNGFLSLKRV